MSEKGVEQRIPSHSIFENKNKKNRESNDEISYTNHPTKTFLITKEINGHIRFSGATRTLNSKETTTTKSNSCCAISLAKSWGHFKMSI